MSIDVTLQSRTDVIDADDDLRATAQRSPGDTGAVHSWELVTSVDGPGTRLTLFLNGCPLRCQYCQNPDTWRMRDGVTHTVAEVMDRIRRYAPVLKATGGGVTISGGEPLLQSAFVARVLHDCRELGLHTALDTSGFLGARASDEMLRDVSLVLLDVKSGLAETYREVTGRELAPTLAFGRRLSDLGVPIWVRFVLVPGLTDEVENVEAVASFAESLATVERVEVLPFHQMGRDKWRRMGEPYRLDATEPPTSALISRVCDQFAAHGLTVF